MDYIKTLKNTNQEADALRFIYCIIIIIIIILNNVTSRPSVMMWFRSKSSDPCAKKYSLYNTAVKMFLYNLLQ